MGAPPTDPVASAPLADYLRRIWRPSLTPESLLSEDELLQALPGRPARAWLREHVAAFTELAGASNTPAEAARRLPGNTPTFVYPKGVRYANRTPFAAVTLDAANSFVEVVWKAAQSS